MINFKSKKSTIISKAADVKSLIKVLLVGFLAAFINIPKFFEYGDEEYEDHQTELRLCKD